MSGSAAKPTYSIAAKGVPSHNPAAAKSVIIPDTSVNGTTMGDPSKSMGFQNVARNGDLLVCQGPDGGLHLYRLNAERSTPTNPILEFVGP